MTGRTLASGVVTLQSIKIFKTHEWINSKPTVYFHCKGENKTILPDVKEIHFLYSYKGEESWQPLTEFVDEKCKRCGLYEKDTLKSDDTFDEWEFCPSDFTAPDGKYVRVKDNELNATFLCPQCVSASIMPNGNNGLHVIFVIIISAVVSTVSVIGVVTAYKYWQKKKREQDHARFLKLFDDSDDIEDELGLGHMI
ncbi:hypothetical protein GIB67_014631 [Kingdonia uniflora]|uniref:DUF7953 domain-containing protein n=1 Tax=Kingdonia uniflora TaxID=39325 RepID=A0A7J7NV23_9MAGN|nr:hypothetical protein GIB67_014631 [Kingdonia uniflora]